jgi:hypothetical protein
MTSSESTILALVNTRNDSDSANGFKNLMMERLSDMKNITVATDPKTKSVDIFLKMVLLEQTNANGDITGYSLAIDVSQKCSFNILEIMSADNIDKLGNLALDYLKNKIFTPYRENKLVPGEKTPEPYEGTDVTH